MANGHRRRGSAARSIAVAAIVAAAACGRDAARGPAVDNGVFEETAEPAEPSARFDTAREGVAAFSAADSATLDEDVNLDPTGELMDVASEDSDASWGTDGSTAGGVLTASGDTGGPTTGGGDGSPPLRGGNGGGGGGGGGREGDVRGRPENVFARAPAPDETKPAVVATWKRARIVPNASRLRVGVAEELPLEGVEAAVRVDGSRARVILDCLFRNDRDRELEGTFELRLPDDASPFYFAFGEDLRATEAAAAAPATPPATVAPTRSAGVEAAFLGTVTASAGATTPGGITAAREAAWTTPKEARMVPRVKAAWAYGETTRRRIDPALLEWSGAGVFSARVFPLGPGKVHRVVLGYDLDLVAAGDAFEFRLDLPPGVAHRAITLSVGAGAAAVVSPAAVARREDGRAIFSFRNPADSAITLRVPNAGVTALRGTDAAAGPCFAATFRPALPATVAIGGAPRAVFLVDTSLSSNAERFPLWLKLMQEILERNRGTLREFAVLFFDVQTRWWRPQFVPNTREAVADLVAHADGLALEGATDLGAALAEGAAPSWDNPAAGAAAVRHDVFLLSDGAATWGAADLAELDANLARGRAAALWAYRTGLAGTAAATLEHLVRESGGAVFSVVGDAEVASAATAHARRGWRVRSVSIDGGKDLLLAGRPTHVFDGQSLRLAGRGAPAAGSAIVLALEQDGRAVEVRTAIDRVLDSDLAPRTYGQIATAQIEELGEAKDSPAQAYATHFRVVGSTCSLLMLDTEEDYERFDIRPADEAARVKTEFASEYVARARAERVRAANDPRAELLACLRRMESTPGLTFAPPPGLLDAISRMPDTAFHVDSPPLACGVVRWKDVPGKLQEQLAAQTPIYDDVSADAARRRAADGSAPALRALSSLVEARPGDTALARDVAYSALEWGHPGPAYHLFRRVARIRPYEPETYRALSDALLRSGNVDLALVWSEVALAGSWDARFGGFPQVAAMDHLRLLRRIDRGELATTVPEFAKARLAEMTKAREGADPDLVVVAAWNTDRTDVDLHVTDPRGEECSYQHTRTAIGGAITADVTQGYGPEMFTLAAPVAGEYLVRARCFASDRLRTSVRSRVLVTIYEGWATAHERVTRKVIDLKDGERMENVATVRVAR